MRRRNDCAGYGYRSAAFAIDIGLPRCACLDAPELLRLPGSGRGYAVVGRDSPRGILVFGSGNCSGSETVLAFEMHRVRDG